MRFSEATREKIKFRARLRCEVCGARVDAGQIHHRQPGGMGGSKHDEVKGSCANGLWVHPFCHDTIEMNRLYALSMGWLVKQGDDPAAAPVKLWDGWWLLAEDATMRKVDGR